MSPSFDSPRGRSTSPSAVCSGSRRSVSRPLGPQQTSGPSSARAPAGFIGLQGEACGWGGCRVFTFVPGSGGSRPRCPSERGSWSRSHPRSPGQLGAPPPPVRTSPTVWREVRGPWLLSGQPGHVSLTPPGCGLPGSRPRSHGGGWGGVVFESLLDPRGIEHVVVFTQEKRALERKMSEMEEEMKVHPLPGPAGPEQPSAPQEEHVGSPGASEAGSGSLGPAVKVSQPWRSPRGWRLQLSGPRRGGP